MHRGHDPTCEVDCRSTYRAVRGGCQRTRPEQDGAVLVLLSSLRLVLLSHRSRHTTTRPCMPSHLFSDVGQTPCVTSLLPYVPAPTHLRLPHRSQSLPNALFSQRFPALPAPTDHGQHCNSIHFHHVRKMVPLLSVLPPASPPLHIPVLTPVHGSLYQPH